MSMHKYDDADFAKMKVIERAIIDAVLPLIQDINPLLACYAMIRCARVMLRKGEPAAQKAILPSVIAYIQGNMQPPNESPLLWVPPDAERRN
jgi:hypothetical protein